MTLAGDAGRRDPFADHDRAVIADVCRRHSIRWLAVFGSFARGDARPDSDVDVLVDFEPMTVRSWDDCAIRSCQPRGRCMTRDDRVTLGQMRTGRMSRLPR